MNKNSKNFSISSFLASNAEKCKTVQKTEKTEFKTNRLDINQDSSASCSWTEVSDRDSDSDHKFRHVAHQYRNKNQGQKTRQSKNSG